MASPSGLAHANSAIQPGGIPPTAATSAVDRYAGIAAHNHPYQITSGTQTSMGWYTVRWTVLPPIWV